MFLFQPSTAVPSFTSSSLGSPNGVPKDPEATKRQLEGVTKYFHEPGFVILGVFLDFSEVQTPMLTARSNDDDLSHYDSRYFHGIVDDEERTDTQSHMIRAYLDFFREKGLDTWIAHGTLLGWWWNGKVLCKSAKLQRHTDAR